MVSFATTTRSLGADGRREEAREYNDGKELLVRGKEIFNSITATRRQCALGIARCALYHVALPNLYHKAKTNIDNLYVFSEQEPRYKLENDPSLEECYPADHCLSLLLEDYKSAGGISYYIRINIYIFK